MQTATRTALILAAGNGSRIRSVAGPLPKPLVPFQGKPLLEHVLIGARDAGIERVVIVVGYPRSRNRIMGDSSGASRECRSTLSKIRITTRPTGFHF